MKSESEPVSLETTPEFMLPIMEQWDHLDAKIARLRERQDVKLFVLLDSIWKWQEGQSIDWCQEIGEETYVYLTKDEQGRAIQFFVRITNKNLFDSRPLVSHYIKVSEYIVDHNQDPHKVNPRLNEKDTEIKRYYAKEDGDENWINIKVHEPSPGERMRTIRYRHNARVGNHLDLVSADSIVVYQGPDDDTPRLDDPNSIKTGYGRTNQVTSNWPTYQTGRLELVRKWNPITKIDPIEAGERMLNLLKSAQLLGRFDCQSGLLVKPEYKNTSAD